MTFPQEPSGRRNAPAHMVLRLALAAGLLIPLAMLYGENLVEACLPAYRGVFNWVADEFRLLSLGIEYQGADRVVRATVAWKHIVVLGGRVLDTDPRGTANASTLIAHALQGPLVAMIAALAWPAHRTREYAWRALLLVPMLIVLVLSDVPCVLAAEIWALVIDALTPGTTSPLVIWDSFLQGGGRYALGFVAAVAAVQWARSLTKAALLP